MLVFMSKADNLKAAKRFCFSMGRANLFKCYRIHMYQLNYVDLRSAVDID